MLGHAHDEWEKIWKQVVRQTKRGSGQVKVFRQAAARLAVLEVQVDALEVPDTLILAKQLLLRSIRDGQETAEKATRFSRKAALNAYETSSRLWQAAGETLEEARCLED